MFLQTECPRLGAPHLRNVTEKWKPCAARRFTANACVLEGLSVQGNLALKLTGHVVAPTQLDHKLAARAAAYAAANGNAAASAQAGSQAPSDDHGVGPSLPDAAARPSFRIDAAANGRFFRALAKHGVAGSRQGHAAADDDGDDASAQPRREMPPRPWQCGAHPATGTKVAPGATQRQPGSLVQANRTPAKLAAPGPAANEATPSMHTSHGADYDLALRDRYGSLELQCLLLQMDSEVFMPWIASWHEELTSDLHRRPQDGSLRISAAMLQSAMEAA